MAAGKSVALYIAPLMYGLFQRHHLCGSHSQIRCCFFAENVGIAIFKLHTYICTHTAVRVSLGTSSLAVAVRRHIGLPPSILHSWQQQALSFSACSPSCTLASIPTGTGTAQIGKTASNRLQPQVLMSPAKRHHKQSQVIFIPPSCIAVSHRVCNLCAHPTDTG